VGFEPKGGGFRYEKLQTLRSAVIDTTAILLSVSIYAYSVSCKQFQ
jgi:hypothetical protein